jgi:hypothetical protein
MQSKTNEARSLFDWLMFLAIHLAFFGIITGVALRVYGQALGAWVSASACIEALSLTYLFHKKVPGETFMKVLLYLFAALGAAYLVHNGARQIGIEQFNGAQVKKYEAGMNAAALTASKKIAATLGASAKDASKIEKLFDDDVSTIAAGLAFLSLFTALCVFAIASRRVAEIEAAHAPEAPAFQPYQAPAPRPVLPMAPPPILNPTGGQTGPKSQAPRLSWRQRLTGRP